MNEVGIRRATLQDVPALARIYNHYVEHSTATFDTQPKSIEDRTDWLTKRTAAHPVIVALHGDRVIGWGALSPFRERRAYVHTAEVAVYVAPECRGEGAGNVLMSALVDAAWAAGHHVLISQVVSDNVASLRLAEKTGFTRVGTMHEVGRKFDRWLDVEILELVSPGTAG